MASEIVGIELDISDGHLGLVGMYSGVGLGELIRLEHVEHGCFTCVIKAQEDDVG